MDSPAPAHGYTLAARLLVRSCDRVTLGTRMASGGQPYVSLAAVATDLDGSPLLLLSTLSDHTRNLLADPSLSVLFDGTAGFANPQEGPRATIMGKAERAVEGELERIRRRYLARHPGASLYAGFADFAFFKVVTQRIHWVGGFGKAAWVERSMLVDAAVASRFATAEPELLVALQPMADRVAQTKLKRRSKGWRFSGVDPDGCLLIHGSEAHGCPFDAPLDDPSNVAAALGVTY